MTGHKNDILTTDDICSFRLMKINSSDIDDVLLVIIYYGNRLSG